MPAKRYRHAPLYLPTNQNECSKQHTYLSTIDDVFACKYQLFELPITGKYFKQQMDGLDLDQVNQMGEREFHVDLPQAAQFSTNMRQLEKVINQ